MRLRVLLKLRGMGLWGSGREDFKADVTTFKLTLAEGELVAIPGPYVKGLLRNWSYKLAPLLARAGLVPQGLSPSSNCMSSNPCGKCIVCLVFGSQGSNYTSLRVSNFYPVDESRLGEVVKLSPDELVESGLLVVRRPSYITHVKMERSSRKAAEGGLYQREFVEPGSTFYGEVSLIESLLQGSIEVQAAARLILASLAQLRLSYVGRRTVAELSVVEGELGGAVGDGFCEEVLRGLRREA